MTESRYLNLNYQDSLNSKKQLLGSEINLINVHRAISNFKNLRKKEFESKNKIKSSMAALRSKINLIQSTFPEEENLRIKDIIKHIKPKINARTKEEKENISYQQELEDIQRKLQRLG